MPRTVNLITGPSRSADIEQTLILGAHGPRRLHVIVVGEAAVGLTCKELVTPQTPTNLFPLL
jgi:L-lactate utilization protein LutB